MVNNIFNDYPNNEWYSIHIIQLIGHTVEISHITFIKSEKYLIKVVLVNWEPN